MWRQSFQVHGLQQRGTCVDVLKKIHPCSKTFNTISIISCISSFSESFLLPYPKDMVKTKISALASSFKSCHFYSNSASKWKIAGIPSASLQLPSKRTCTNTPNQMGLICYGLHSWIPWDAQLGSKGRLLNKEGSARSNALNTWLDLHAECLLGREPAYYGYDITSVVLPSIAGALGEGCNFSFWRKVNVCVRLCDFLFFVLFSWLQKYIHGIVLFVQKIQKHELPFSLFWQTFQATNWFLFQKCSHCCSFIHTTHTWTHTDQRCIS